MFENIPILYLTKKIISTAYTYKRDQINFPWDKNFIPEGVK